MTSHPVSNTKRIINQSFDWPISPAQALASSWELPREFHFSLVSAPGLPPPQDLSTWGIRPHWCRDFHGLDTKRNPYRYRAQVLGLSKQETKNVPIFVHPGSRDRGPASDFNDFCLPRAHNWESMAYLSTGCLPVPCSIKHEITNDQSK